ncbi:uncharacterized protein LOC119353105 isoform X2 [Triticum dicoccoides]|uniref:uncharacterized protein LOC119353105 isoform X2 n=1 Tax=Triticum dicoccoides TaxID=85692 RepID=UPI00188F0D8F|nr:uncharacterized protein LOC119353105 isoform X2 [Triticum dicoccoides]
MLKNYVPPGCPMHMFVQKYMRLQFGRESDENYEEKRTRIGKPLMRANLAVERHASKIYTRAMFEQFGQILYESGAYQVQEVEKQKTYIAIHSDAERREKWCRVSYKVTMLDGGNEFECECGQFAHMGLLCSHVLKVLDFIRAKEILAKHIVKRCTKDATDVLPAHLAQYQKDKIRDGLGLEDRIADKGVVVNERIADAVVADQNDKVVGLAADIGENDSMSRTSNRLDGLLAPAKRKEMGRPTTSREKAPYEGLSKRTRFCMICHRQGHKRTTCPDRGDIPKQPRKSARCKNCGVEGHRRNNCNKAMELRLAGGM